MDSDGQPTLEELGTAIRRAKGSWGNFRAAVEDLKDSTHFSSLDPSAQEAVTKILALDTTNTSERGLYNTIADYRNLLANKGVPYDTADAEAAADMPYWDSGLSARPQTTIGGRKKKGKKTGKKSRKQRRKTLRRKR